MGDVIQSFPGYERIQDKEGKYHNMYRGVDLGRGGYVYGDPGIYTKVALIDAASMHPTSIIMLNKLGEYTERYAMLKNARVYIKHHDIEALSKLFDGKLIKYLGSDEDLDNLSTALKYPTNAFYGISTAGFDNPAKDPRDVNNIIALRGALFMKTLQDAVEEQGYHIVAIRTDSCKIPNATPEIIQFVIDFGKKYGYEMEHEATYDRMCLVNDAVYIAKYDDKGIRNKGGKHANEWTATGAQFMHPYVFKKLFSHEPITFKDKCELKTCKTGFYLDMNERLPEGEHDYQFVGQVGEFCPIKPGCGGGLLYRQDKKVEGMPDTYSFATRTKDWRWLDSEYVKVSGKEKDIDDSYYKYLIDEAVAAINKYGDFERFVADAPYETFDDFMNIPETDDEEVPFL